MDKTPFGRYQLVELLGRGGMGEVWRAFDTAIDRVVALKVLPASFAGDKVFQERFRREARAAAGLDEPHVVPIYDFGEIDGRLYVTMRLVDGRDLESVLGGGPLDPARAVGVIEQVACAQQCGASTLSVHAFLDQQRSSIVRLLAKEEGNHLCRFAERFQSFMLQVQHASSIRSIKWTLDSVWQSALCLWSLHIGENTLY